MGYQERKALIKSLEDKRGSRIVSCYLADRETHPEGIPGFAMPISMEAQIEVLTLLEQIGHVERLDLLLYTRGGNTDCVWPLVTTMRAYCDEFAVLVPHRAHSAGTMICLGANEVVMSKCAELSPIDATTGNQFNPRDPINPQVQYGISVEDVGSYFELAKRLGGITDEPHLLEVFKQLTSQVHPLALGNVERVHQLVQRLAQQLLSLHLDPVKDEHAIKEIVGGLTREFFSHSHAVMRDEAKRLFGDWVKVPDDELATALDSTHRTYVADLHLRGKFDTSPVSSPMNRYGIYLSWVASWKQPTALSSITRRCA